MLDNDAEVYSPDVLRDDSEREDDDTAGEIDGGVLAVELLSGE
jgi:hypothetical protein